MKTGDPGAKMMLDSLTKPPHSPESLDFYYQAFWKLCSCRQIGMGVGPMPWTAVREYSQFLGLDEEDFLEFQECMLAMDRTYLEYQNKNTKPSS